MNFILNIGSNLKKLISGNTPTTNELAVGEMGFGKTSIDNQYHIFGNSDGNIIDYSNFVKPPIDNTKLMAIYNSVWGDISPSPAVINSGNYREIYVNGKWSLDTTVARRDGSWAFPYSTIQQAIDSVPNNNTNPVIIYVSHLDIYSAFTINNKSGISIVGNSQQTYSFGDERHPVLISGTSIISGTSSNIHLINLQFGGEISLRSTGNSTCYLDNCRAVTCSITSISTVLARMQNCMFTFLSIAGSSSTTEAINCTTGFFDIDAGDRGFYQITNGKLTCTDCKSINIYHQGGTYVSRGLTTYDGNSTTLGTNIGIRSTTNTGSLLLLEGSMYNGSQSFVKINKTGSCNYEILPSFIYDKTTSTFTGSNVSPISSIVPYDTSIWTPADYGLKAWSFDSAMSTNSTVLTAGQIYVVRLKVPQATTISKLVFKQGAVGVGVTDFRVAIYQPNAANTQDLLLAETANEATAVNTIGQVKTFNLVTPANVQAGYFDVAFWSLGGTTQPTFARCSGQPGDNLGLTTINLRFATANTGMTTGSTSPAVLGTKFAVTGGSFFICAG